MSPLLATLARPSLAVLPPLCPEPTHSTAAFYFLVRNTLHHRQAPSHPLSHIPSLYLSSSGGYLDESLWEKEGWKWRCFRNVKWPTFWKPVGPSGLHQYRLRTIFEEIDMPWNWPAVVNYHEAKAFANWRSDSEGIPRDKGYRLTTEGESLRMLNESAFDESLGVNRDPGMVHDGLDMPEKAGCNLNLAYGSESPVDALPSARFVAGYARADSIALNAPTP